MNDRYIPAPHSGLTAHTLYSNSTLFASPVIGWEPRGRPYGEEHRWPVVLADHGTVLVARHAVVTVEGDLPDGDDLLARMDASGEYGHYQRGDQAALMPQRVRDRQVTMTRPSRLDLSPGDPGTIPAPAHTTHHATPASPAGVR